MYINRSITYAENYFSVSSLESLHPVVFYDKDSSDDYSASLRDDMKAWYGDKIITYVPYSSKNSSPASWQKPVQDNVKPAVNRLVYFAGYENDGEEVLKALHELYSKPEFQNVKHLFLGGDTLYQLHYYNGNDQYPSDADGLLNFTAMVYPDKLNSKDPFTTDYTADFGGNNPNSHKSPSGVPYGYIRADQDVILSYDGLSLIVRGAKNMHKNGNLSLTAQLRAALAAFDASHPFPGESGPIYFLGSGDNQGGQVLIICVNRNGDGGVCYPPSAV